MWHQLLSGIINGDIKALARSITLVENEQPGYEQLLQQLPFNDKKVIGITGPPGAGKSTLADAMIHELVNNGKRVAVLCVDPSSPFSFGSLLGDRVRMSEWYTHDDVFIRSLATRGSLGGLNPKIMEITELVKAGPFDQVIIETVGVGQSEIEITGLADVTIVVLVPEAGDEVQTMKAGLMEIADIFVVNKSDRPGADIFVKNIRLMLSPAFHHSALVPVIKTVASERKGIGELMEAIDQILKSENDKKVWLMTEKAYSFISRHRMKDIDKEILKADIKKAYTNGEFNLFQFISEKYFR